MIAIVIIGSLVVLTAFGLIHWALRRYCYDSDLGPDENMRRHVAEVDSPDDG